jgi:signal transduction histidine kinase
MAGIIVYASAIAIAEGATASLINRIVCTAVSLAASISALLTAKRAALTPLQRRGWSLIGLACAIWSVAQLLMTFVTLFPPMPTVCVRIAKSLFLLSGALMLPAIGWLADAPRRTRLTVHHLSNLGLIACCLAVLLVLVLFEPIAQLSTTDTTWIGKLAECTFMSLMFFVALYHLWTQRWVASWPSMLVLTVGTAIYSLGNLNYMHALLTGRFAPENWVNLSWAPAFIAVGLAAHLQRMPALIQVAEAEAIRRGRAIAATVPALLMLLMIVVGVLTAQQITERALVLLASLVIGFAIILGVREAWIQREARRLTRELRMANDRLSRTNRELLASEMRVRDLHGHLEERIAERTHELQRAYEELESFAYAVAHDLRAPLRAIDGFGHLLEEEIRERADPQSRAYIERIRRSAFKMATLIEDLLAYSRTERRPLSIEPLALDEAVAEVVAEYDGSPHRNYELRVEVPPVRVLADREALILVLRNLIGNAVKFSAPVPSPRIEIRAAVLANAVSIEVRDNGIGFDMQYREQIFKLFHRLHRDDQYEGTGIGLALVRKALERMHGRVRAESKEGEGATFVVELPLA